MGPLPDWIHALLMIVIWVGTAAAFACFTGSLLGFLIGLVLGRLLAGLIVSLLPGFWGK